MASLINVQKRVKEVSKNLPKHDKDRFWAIWGITEAKFVAPPPYRKLAKTYNCSYDEIKKWKSEIEAQLGLTEFLNKDRAENLALTT